MPATTARNTNAGSGAVTGHFDYLTLPFDSDNPAPVVSIATVRRARTVPPVPTPTTSTPHRPTDAACSDALTQVAAFHQAFNLPLQTLPNSSIPEELRQLRVDLLLEEVGEFVDATGRQHIADIADALADIVYVTYGAALTYGIDLDAVVAEVHRSNMSKLDEHGRPVLREDGKVLKSQRYFRPDITAVLADQLELPF